MRRTILGAGAGNLDHGALQGLSDDDHPYILESLVDANTHIGGIVDNTPVGLTPTQSRSILATVDDTAPAQRVSGTNGLSARAFLGRKTSAGPPTGSTWAVGDEVVDSNGVFWRCTVAGTPGTWAPFGAGIIAKARRATVQSIASGGGGTPVEFTAADVYDDYGFHDPAANSGRRLAVPTSIGGTTVTMDGKYRFIGTVSFVAALAGYRAIVWNKNGAFLAESIQTIPSVGTGAPTVVQATLEIALVGGDYIECLAFQTSGSALDAYSTYDLTCTVEKIG